MMITKPRPERLSASDHKQFNALSWEIRQRLFFMKAYSKGRALKKAVNEAVKAINNVREELSRAYRRDYPAMVTTINTAETSVEAGKEGEGMAWVERVAEFDNAERGLIAVRLNEPCFNISPAASYRKGDILLFKTFDDTVTLREGSIYLSLVNEKHLFIERFNEDPAGWREPEPGFFYSTILAGYSQVTPSDQVAVIGELFGVKDERPVVVIQSGFVKGNPSKRLNYRFEGNHTAKQYCRFIDVCQGRSAFDLEKDAIGNQAERMVADHADL